MSEQRATSWLGVLLLHVVRCQLDVQGGLDVQLDWHIGVGCDFSGFMVEFLGVAAALERALPGRVALYSGACSERFLELLFPPERRAVRLMQQRAAAPQLTSARARISVVHGPCSATKVRALRDRHGDGDDGRHFVVARVMVESTLRPPETMIGCMSEADAVWVPTAWHVATMGAHARRAGVAPAKLTAVGEAVDGTLFSRAASALGTTTSRPRPSNHTFTFLSIFKWERRKGWDVLLRAFWSAFPPASGCSHDQEQEQARPRLVVRSWKPHWEPGPSDVAEHVRALAARVSASAGHGSGELAPVEVVSGGVGAAAPAAAVAGAGGALRVGALSRPALRDLLLSADAFVLPTRGEGWGLPVAEAMTAGLPTLVTNCSGVTGYASAQNALLIPVVPTAAGAAAGADAGAAAGATASAAAGLRDGMAEVVATPALATASLGEGTDGLAEPDVQALAALMRRVVAAARSPATHQSHSDLNLTAVGAAARRDMLHRWSPDAVVGQIMARIQDLTDGKMAAAGAAEHWSADKE